MNDYDIANKGTMSNYGDSDRDLKGLYIYEYSQYIDIVLTGQKAQGNCDIFNS